MRGFHHLRTVIMPDFYILRIMASFFLIPIGLSSHKSLHQKIKIVNLKDALPGLEKLSTVYDICQVQLLLFRISLTQ